MKKEINSTDEVSLLQKAENRLKNNHSEKTALQDEVDYLKLYHELEVHKIELEMQNAELQLAKEKAEQTAQKFAELFAEHVEITNPQRIEESLRNAKDFAESLIRTANVIVIGLDNAGKVNIMNEAAEKITGYTFEELKEKSWFEMLVPKEKFPDVWMEFLELTQNGKLPKTFENKILTKSGEERIISWQNSLLKEGEKNTGTLSFGIDFTERKQTDEALKESEERHRLLADNASDVIWTMDLNGRFTYVSPSVAKLRGYTAAEVINQSIDEVFTLESAIIAKKALMTTFTDLQAGKTPADFQSELEQKCKDGSTVWTEVTSSGMYNVSNEFIGILGVTRNISKRRMMEAELRLSEMKYRTLHESIMDGFALVDMEGKIIEFNESFRQMLGYDNEELVKLSYEDITPEKWHLFEMKIVESQVLTRGYSEVYEKEYRKSDGTIFPVELRSVLIRDEQGVNNGMWAIIRDISGRKQTEESLRENEARLNLALQISHSGCFDWNLATNESIWSDELKLIHGLQPDDTFESLGDFLSCLVADDRSYVMEEMQRMIEQGGSVINKYRICRRDNGEIRWVEARCQFFGNHANQTAKIIGVVSDITENKKAEELLKINEEKFKQLIHNSFDMVVLIDSSGIQRFVSESCEKILGYRTDELINIPVIEQMIHPDDQQEILKVFANAEKLGSGGAQYRHRHKNGTWVYLEAYGTNQISNPIINSYVLNVRDITERKQVEEALKESEARLNDLNATKDKFFSIIAHDLRNPFSNILGFSNLLERHIKDKDYEGIEKYAGIIHNSSKRAMSLLINLLEWARSQTGSIEFNPEYIEFRGLLDEVISLINDSICQKSITILTDLPRHTVIFADKSMLATIFRNLISNAVKYTNQGGKINVSVRQNPGEWLVSVADNGVGIKKQAIDKLFRIDKSYTTIGTQNEKGTGLGLLLCKEFIKKHEGRIWVESEERKGSTFHFTIPKA